MRPALVLLVLVILAGCAGEPQPDPPARTPAPAADDSRGQPLGPPPPPANPVLLQPATPGTIGAPPMPPAVAA